MILQRIALGLVLVLCAVFCLTQLAEVDHYWHLLAGQQILDEHRVPRADSFSFTSSGRPWIDLHWLFQVILASVDRYGGWSGINLLKIALIVGGFGLAVCAALRRAGPLVVAPLATLAVLASQERFALRPEAASFLLFGALLLCLETGRRRPGRFFLLPALIALWANLHALYAAGLVVIGLALTGDRIARYLAARGRPVPEPARGGRKLLAAAAIAIPATLLTPFGFGAWSLPRQLFLERIATGNVYGRSIAEFQAPFSGFGVTVAVIAFAALTATIAAAVIAAPARLRVDDFLILAAFFGLALLARRNIPLFALASLPAGAAALEGALHRLRRSRIGSPRLWGRALAAPLLAGVTALACLALIVDVISNRFFERDGTQRYFGSGPAPGFYPEGAARFVSRQPIEGEVLNDMTMGGYLAWQWHPRRRVFIDGRLEVHDPDLFRSFLDLQQNPQRFEAIARRYGIGAVLWSHRHSSDAVPLIRHLAGSENWRPVFVDLAAVLFVRDSELPEIDLGAPQTVDAVLDQLRQSFSASNDRDPLPGWLRRLVPKREVPVAEVSAALFFDAVGQPLSAERLLAAALQRAPGNPVLHYDRGLVLSRAGRDAEAREAFETAVRLSGSFVEAWAALAMLDLRAGDEPGALRRWATAERHGALPAPSLQARGALRARRGEIDEAIQDYREALRRDPQRSGARAELALLYHHRGFASRAEAEVRRALESAPLDCKPRVVAAQLRLAADDPEEALTHFREAERIAPACAEAPAGGAALLLSLGRQGEAIDVLEAALRRGVDAGRLSADPRLRMLMTRPEIRDLVERSGRFEEGPP